MGDEELQSSGDESALFRRLLCRLRELLDDGRRKIPVNKR